MQTMPLRAMPGALAAALLLSLGLGASLARAQSRAETVGGWMVRDERGFCSAATSRDPNTLLRLTYDVRANSAGLHVWSPAWGWIVQRQAYEVELRFSNGRSQRGAGARGVQLLILDSTPINGLWMSFSGGEILDDFARSASVDLLVGERRSASLSLGDTRAAMQRLRACATRSARSHPPSPSTTATAGGGGAEIARPPIHLSGTVTEQDYPAAALRAGEQGRVTIEMAVDAAGLVTGCTVLRSSGSAALDSATCAIAQSRFRFTPAIDGNGRNVAGTATRTIAWIIPEPDPEPNPEPAEDS